MSAERTLHSDPDDLAHYMEATGRLARRTKALEDALRQIAELDPDLTHDGYQRDDLCRYQDEVYAIAEAAVRERACPRTDQHQAHAWTLTISGEGVIERWCGGVRPRSGDRNS